MSTSTLGRATTADELGRAAERRAAGAQQRGYRTAGQGPGARGFTPPEGPGRSVEFPAVLRAKKATYNDQELYHLNGIASVVNLGYEMWDWAGPFTEVMDSGAFTKTLAADPDTVFLENHRGLTMARTRGMPGRLPTLLLGMVSGPEDTDNGLGSDAYVNPKRTDVSNLVTAIDDGVVTEMSFAFMLNEGWWSDDFTTFKITEVDIDRGDVSAVNYGANPHTSIAARQREILTDLRHMPVGAAQAAFRELARREDVDVDTLYQAYSQGTATDLVVAAVAKAESERTVPVALGRSILHVEALLAEE